MIILWSQHKWKECHCDPSASQMALEIKVTDCFDRSKFFPLKGTFLKTGLSLLSRKAHSISHSIQRYCEVITVTCLSFHQEMLFTELSGPLLVTRICL